MDPVHLDQMKDAERILSLCNITRGQDENMFWWCNRANDPNSYRWFNLEWAQNFLIRCNTPTN